MAREFNRLGDAIAGEKITIEAMSIERIWVSGRTSRHRGHFGVMRRNAYAIIDIPFRYVLEKRDGKSKGTRH